MNDELKRLEQALATHVRLGSFPVAVKMVKEGEKLPERVKHPLKDMNIKVANCQALAMARRYGYALAVGQEDLSCPLTAVAFGFRKASGFYNQGQACEGMYTETAEAGKKSEAQVEKFEYGEYRCLLAAPLHHTEFDPDVIVIYGNSAQVMRLLTAALWKEGGRLTSTFGGRIDCAEEIIAPLKSRKCEIILPCYGDRIFAHTQDHEMAFSIPNNRMGEIVEGLEGTHQGGVRYPVPGFLRYTGEFPPHYAKAAE